MKSSIKADCCHAPRTHHARGSPHSMTATSTGNVIDHSSGGIVASLKMFATNERTKIEF